MFQNRAVIKLHVCFTLEPVFKPTAVFLPEAYCIVLAGQVSVSSGHYCIIYGCIKVKGSERPRKSSEVLQAVVN